jgi:uridylate kinase
LPIKVFNLKDEDSLSSIVKGEEIGTLISWT